MYQRVAPHAGAWIETPWPFGKFLVNWSRPSRRGVDWNSIQQEYLEQKLKSPLTQGRGLKQEVVVIYKPIKTGRPSRRGVDWNTKGKGREYGQHPVAPHAGAWIETSSSPTSAVQRWVAPHAGAWIETSKFRSVGEPFFVAPHAGAWIETRVNLKLTIKDNVAPHAGAWIET